MVTQRTLKLELRNVTPVFESSVIKVAKVRTGSAVQVSGGLGRRRRRRADGGSEAGVVVQLADVFLQVEVAAESLPAGGAGEGLFVVVCVHVEREVVDLMERLVADGAFVLLLAAVRQLVVLIVSCKTGSDTRERRGSHGLRHKQIRKVCLHCIQNNNNFL